MPSMVNGALRSEAQYRITFEPDSFDFHGTIARVGDIMRAFSVALSEVRITADGIAVYVMIPAGVLPEALDAKAEALRAKWRETPTAPKRTWTIDQIGAAWGQTMEQRHPLAAVDGGADLRADWKAIEQTLLKS